MKYYIYNPSPPDNCLNPLCKVFHTKTGIPYHNYDCYKEVEPEQKEYFQCGDRIHELSLPKPRHINRKYEKQLQPYRRTRVFKQSQVSSRIEHLAAVSFRRVFAAREYYEHRTKVRRSVIKNLNMHIQKSLYNVYSRLANVQFPKFVESPKRQPIIRSSFEYQNRVKIMERLSQPRKIFAQEIEEEVIRERRPINMATIDRLSMPRKKNPSDDRMPPIMLKQSIQGSEYYKKLSQPKKDFEALFIASQKPNEKIKSMNRTRKLAVQWARLQKRKFMKGDNDPVCFTVSRAALKYEPSAKIRKLAVPKKVAANPDEAAVKGKKKK